MHATEYFVINDHTLCYTLGDTDVVGVLEGKVPYGRDPTRGSSTVCANETVRPATCADFQDFRVFLSPRFQTGVAAQGNDCAWARVRGLRVVANA